MRRGLPGLLGAAWLVAAAQASELPDPAGDWRALTPEAVRAAAPTRFDGGNVELVPLRWIYSFPTTTYLELEDQRRRRGLEQPLEAIVIADGTYGLDRLAELLGPAAFEKTGPSTYIARRPLLVAPTATLVVRDETLRLAIDGMALVAYHGDVFIIGAEITTWDERAGDAGARPALSQGELLALGEQRLRPYLLGLRGSRSYFAASTFHGLGYHGPSGTFGISLAAYGDPPAGRADSLSHVVAALPPPSGVLVGNTISRAFFGFFTNKARATALVGNVFVDSVVYGIDPHDYSYDIVVARNLVTGTRHKHGIIFSRSVDRGRIVENVTAANGGSGIMLDRKSNDVAIEDNIVLANAGDGIAVFESRDTEVHGNLVVSNVNDGVHVRNSEGADVRGNVIDRNGHFGIEVRTADLDDHRRDTELDAYTRATEVSIIGNALHRNLTAAIAAKGNSEAVIGDNDFADSAPLLFGGDLEPVGDDVLRANAGDGYRHEPPGSERP